MSKISTPQDDYAKTTVRMPPEVRDELRAAAKAAGRTLNAEILDRIAQAQERGSFKLLLKQNEELKTMLRDVLAAIELLK